VEDGCHVFTGDVKASTAAPITMKNLIVQSIQSANALLSSAAGLSSDCIRHFCLSGAGDGLLYCATNAGLVMCISGDGQQVLTLSFKPRSYATPYLLAAVASIASLSAAPAPWDSSYLKQSTTCRT
jgi:hypothetical protein